MRKYNGKSLKSFVTRTNKTKVPALWESGGAGGGFPLQSTKLGQSCIITDFEGKAKDTVFIRGNLVLACSHHALIPVARNDHIITVNRLPESDDINIYRIDSIEDEVKQRQFQSIKTLYGTQLKPFLLGSFDVRFYDFCPQFYSDMTVQLITACVNNEWWDNKIAEEFEDAIKAAIEKAKHFHCREPHYVGKLIRG